MRLKDSKTLFTALADETRLRILNLLAEEELCVCDLMTVLKEPQSKVSRHLAYLRRSGLVESRRGGLWMYYRRSKPANKMLRGVFEALDNGRADTGELVKDIAAYRKNRGCLVACCK